jgi:tetratricopeptide (TPR) repeat protein
MWSEAAASNEDAWAASNKWVKQNNLPVSQRDYHSLHWLLYSYLQQGRYQEAEERLALMDKSLAKFPEDNARNLMYDVYTRASMAAAFVVETERWDTAENLFSPPLETARDSRTSSGSNPYQAFAVLAHAPAIFANGLAAANTGAPDAETSITKLRTMHEQLAKQQMPVAAVADLVPVLEIQQLEIAAALRAANGDFDEAAKTMEKAIAKAEEAPPPSGPPLSIKPTHELFGEILLRTNRPKEAADQFAKSLFRHPSRARSLLGAARAAAQSGATHDAAKFYRQFEKQWQQTDTQTRELHESRAYLKQQERKKVSQ